MKSIPIHPAKWVATLFGIGYLPVAPGSWASIVALGFWVLLPQFSQVVMLLFIFCFFLLGLFTSSFVVQQSGNTDPPQVVIDECVGMWIALLGVPRIGYWLFLSFVLFRFFDMFKIFPIRELEKLPKGWGVMLDDVLAGIYSFIMIHMIRALL